MYRISLLILCLLFTTSTLAKDYSRLFNKVNSTVVEIGIRQTQTTVTSSGSVSTTNMGLGSGVLISKEGHILTASHVVHNADQLMVELADGSMHGARILASIPSADLALIILKKPPENLKFAKLGDSSKAAIGAEIIVIGAPYGLSHTLTAGNISQRKKIIDPIMFEEIEFLQTDASINKGNSGGPMFNHRGEVIGIVSYIQTQSGGSEGLGFAIAINIAKRLLLDNPGLWWGMRYIPIKENALRALNVPDYDHGLLIQNVAEGSLASAFHLRPGTIPVIIEGQPILLGGDVLVEIGGYTLYRTPKSVARLQTYLASVAVGEELELTVFRDGKRKKLVANKPASQWTSTGLRGL